MKALALVLLAGCSSGPVLTKRLGDYIAHQNPPLTSVEVDRLYARQTQLGDTLERVQAAWEGCEIELARNDGSLAIYDAHVPYGTRKIHVGAETVGENGKVILTFDHKQLKFFVVLDAGLR